MKQKRNLMTRREVLKRAAVAGTGALAASMLNRGIILITWRS
jgi:hypothetical protein